jgi:NAD(P)-dependent dehydrogenase (short-subunit alcohol dehydrogenase family)
MSESFEKSATYIIDGSSGMGLATARLLVEDGGTALPGGTPYSGLRH